MQPTIHFIWAGGTKLLPAQNQSIIRSWANENPDAHFCIWIDKQSYPKPNELETHYTQFFSTLKKFPRVSYMFTESIDFSVKVRIRMKMIADWHFS